MNPNAGREPDVDDVLRRLGKAMRDANAAHAVTEDAGAARPEADDALADRITDAVMAQQRAPLRQPRRSIRRHWIAWASAAVIAALAATANLRFAGSPSATGLPAYALEVSGFDREERSLTTAATPGNAITRGNRLVVVLRPQQAASSSIDVSVWQRRDAGIRRVQLPLRVADSGAVRIDAVLGRELDLDLGEQLLWVVVAKPGQTPLPAQIGAIATPTRSADWSITPLALTVRAP